MFNHGWSIVCENKILDKDKNTITIINCIENITVRKLPAKLERIYLISFWYKDDLKNKKTEKLSLRIIFEQPDGDEKQLGDDIVLKVDNPKQRVVVEINDLELTREGDYYFRVEGFKPSWKVVARLPFSVLYEPQKKTKTPQKKKKKKKKK